MTLFNRYQIVARNKTTNKTWSPKWEASPSRMITKLSIIQQEMHPCEFYVLVIKPNSKLNSMIDVDYYKLVSFVQTIYLLKDTKEKEHEADQILCNS